MGTVKEGKNVLMGIGNPLRGDDGAGIAVAEGLKNTSQNCGWNIINCGMYPENFTRDLKRQGLADMVVMVDAVDMALPPGEIRKISDLSQKTIYLTTHRIPLSSLTEYIKTIIPKTMFIGIQPRDIKNSKKLTEPVGKAVEKLISLFSKLKLDEIKTLE